MNKTFNYQLLDRMKGDCLYFLGYGNRYEKHLYYESVDKHIKEMKKLYNSFSDEDKPEWLTMKDIEILHHCMTHEPVRVDISKKCNFEKCIIKTNLIHEGTWCGFLPHEGTALFFEGFHFIFVDENNKRVLV